MCHFVIFTLLYLLLCGYFLKEALPWCKMSVAPASYMHYKMACVGKRHWLSMKRADGMCFTAGVQLPVVPLTHSPPPLILLFLYIIFPSKWANRETGNLFFMPSFWRCIIIIFYCGIREQQNMPGVLIQSFCYCWKQLKVLGIPL